MFNRSHILFFILTSFFSILGGKAMAQSLPQLGAELFIEPGQSKQEIDNWVKTLKDGGMPIARVFMLWNYIEVAPDKWDFGLYDELFKAAEKYGVKITVTLVPNQPPFFWGQSFFYYTHNMKMYRKKDYRGAAENYIRKVVLRYKDSPALDSWWLYNEPSGHADATEFAIEMFRKWLKNRYHSIDSLNKNWHSYFRSFRDVTYDPRWLTSNNWIWQAAYYDWNVFGTVHINKQISWLRQEVEKYDRSHPFTTNPPGVFGSLAHYDLTNMDTIVDIAGSSLHPSWSFSWVPREKFGLAISWQNDLLYGVTGSRKPYWISELQGGSNWLGSHPMNPSPDEIAQWTWTSIGSGAQRIIYWLLNSRMQGQESNEWALLDFQNNPSSRMKIAETIADNLNQFKNYFEDSKPAYSPITIIVSPRTLLMQERKYSSSGNKVAAVQPLAHQKASMAIYNAFMECGIPVHIELIDNFDWETKGKDCVAILADAISLSDKEITNIKHFVSNGNDLFITGLTGIYDENEKSWLINRKFPMEELLGGNIKDILSDSIKFSIKLSGYKDSLPSQLIYSQIIPKTGKIIGEHRGVTVALMNDFKNGRTYWIPSMIGVAGWEYGEHSLSSFFMNQPTIKKIVDGLPLKFDSYHEDCYIRTLKSKNGYITIVSNGSSQTQSIHILSNGVKKSQLLYGDYWNKTTQKLVLYAGHTAVLYWE